MAGANIACTFLETEMIFFIEEWLYFFLERKPVILWYSYQLVNNDSIDSLIVK